MRVASSVCENGFENFTRDLSDTGYYGSGIYLTTSAKYASKYAALQFDSALVISFCMMGNVFPVTERHDLKGTSLMGKQIDRGYQSHYALVETKQGTVIKDHFDPNLHADEIVIPHGSQILPVFLLQLKQPGQR